MSSTPSILRIKILAVNAIDKVMFLTFRVFDIIIIVHELAISGDHPSPDSDPLRHRVLVQLGGRFAATVGRHATLVYVVVIS